MNWSIVGWGTIGVAVVLLAAFSILIKNKKPYLIRKFPQLESLRSSRTDAIEAGVDRVIVLGHKLFSTGYPGLGLTSLSAIPDFLDDETLADGKINLASSEGSLVVFAQQIIENTYLGGFSRALTPEGVRSTLLGPTPFSFTAGLLSGLSEHSHRGLVLTGYFGPEASLWSEACESKNGYTFSSAGTITSQAALYLHAKDLLIGENAYLLSGMFDPRPGKNAGWLTEDILRILLIILLVTGVILKLVGIL